MQVGFYWIVLVQNRVHILIFFGTFKFILVVNILTVLFNHIFKPAFEHGSLSPFSKYLDIISYILHRSAVESDYCYHLVNVLSVTKKS